jgi:hypothetical protein
MNESQIAFRIRMLRCPIADEKVTDLFAELIGNGLYRYDEATETLTMHPPEGQSVITIKVTDKGLLVKLK